MSLFIAYSICFAVGLLFTLVSAALGHVFTGHDIHLHLSPGHEAHTGSGGGLQGMPEFSPLSPTTLASFLCAFGGFGMILSNISATQSPWISAPLALLGGLAVAALVFWIFKEIFRHTQGSSEARISVLAGSPATVITPVPAGGVGEIAYVQQGTRYTAPARGEDGAALTAGTAVRITRIVGVQFFVAPPA
ncbi:MAG TPA: NfeD family protein [Opitutaceae bacterium]|nr:NfeD family protein [Opitutaceae bacterium]